MSDHVRLEPFSGRLVVKIGTATIVDTTDVVAVHEGSSPVRYYVPEDEVDATLSPSSGAHSPVMGEWHHLDMEAGGRTIASAGWSYYEPTEAFEAIRDYVAFYPERVDAFELTAA